MAENQATGEQGTLHFLRNYPQIWHQWLPGEVISKIEAAL